MPAASIQFSQGILTPAAGQSALGFAANALVTMTDAAGPGATSWSWQIVGIPGPLSGAPTVNNPATQTATTTPTLDGVYVVKLTRTDGAVVTTDARFFAIGDTDYGFVLPSAGMTGNMTNVLGSAVAQAGGWEGRQDGGTNVFVDALFRFLRSRAGRFLGLLQTISFAGASPSTVTVTDAVDKPWRTLNLTGSGLYTEQIDKTGSIPTGKRFLYKISLTAGSGGFALLNGIAGTSIMALVAPPNGTFTYNVEVGFDGTDWVVQRISVADPLAVPKTLEVPAVSGLQSTSQIVATRIGSFRLNPSKYPANAQVTFQVAVETTGPQVTVQLYNLTDSAIVSGSVLTSFSTTPAFLTSGALTLPAGQKDYEVQLFMASGAPTDHVECTSAKVILTWG